MSSRPDNLARRVPGAVVASFTPPRSHAPSGRNAPRWPAIRHAQQRTTLHHAGGPAYAAAPRRLDAQARPAGKWRGADLSDALDPFGLPAVPRVRDNYNRWRVARITTWETAGHAARLISFSLVVIIAHLAALRWIFLPIGG